MSGERMLARLYRWWRPLCEVEGCERSAGYFATCDTHAAKEWREHDREQERQRFERDVRVHLEALRRFDAEKSSAAQSEGVR